MDPGHRGTRHNPSADPIVHVRWTVTAPGIIWQTLPAVLLALACGSETVTETGASSTTASSGGAGGDSTSASIGTGGTSGAGGTTGAGGTSGTGGAAPTSCRGDKDCLPEEACRYTTSDGCDDPLPHCVGQMSDSDCERGQKWDDPSSTVWACLCAGGFPSVGLVYLECGTQGYPEPVSPAGRPCGPP
jgi:hypothetical protein